MEPFVNYLTLFKMGIKEALWIGIAPKASQKDMTGVNQ